MPCGTCFTSWDDTTEFKDDMRSLCPDPWHIPYRNTLPNGGICSCGLPLSRNPHPDAGIPTIGTLEIGYVWVCIPCTQKALHGWATRAQRAESAIRSHHQATTSPGCGNHHQTRDERLWGAVGLSRWGEE